VSRLLFTFEVCVVVTYSVNRYINIFNACASDK